MKNKISETKPLGFNAISFELVILNVDRPSMMVKFALNRFYARIYFKFISCQIVFKPSQCRIT